MRKKGLPPYVLGNYYLYKKRKYKKAIKYYLKSIYNHELGYTELAEIYLNILSTNIDLGLYYLEKAMLIEGIDAYRVGVRFYKRIQDLEKAEELQKVLDKYDD